MSLAELRTWLEALAEAEATVPARVVLLRLPGGVTGEAGVDLTADEVAKLLHRSPSTVRTWCRAGTLPGAYRLQGREWRIPRRAMDALREGKREGPKADRGRVPDLGKWRGEIHDRRAS